MIENSLMTDNSLQKEEYKMRVIMGSGLNLGKPYMSGVEENLLVLT